MSALHAVLYDSLKRKKKYIDVKIFGSEEDAISLLCSVIWTLEKERHIPMEITLKTITGVVEWMAKEFRADRGGVRDVNMP